jgi:hypothetical protein
VSLCSRRRIVVVSEGETLSHIWSLLASRLAALLKLRARYSAENTNLTPEGEPVVACRPIKSHRCAFSPGPTVTGVIVSRLSEFIPALPLRASPPRSVRSARQDLLVLDGPLDGFDRVLEIDEDFTHPFRLTALVCLCQCISNVAALFYLTVPASNQLSNVVIFLTIAVISLKPCFGPCEPRLCVLRPLSEVTDGLPALIVSASSRYRAPASGAQPFPFAYDGVSLRVRERGKEPGKNEPPSPSSARPVQRPETAFRTQQDDGGLPYGHRWSFRLQAPERREGTLLLGRPFAAPHPLRASPAFAHPLVQDVGFSSTEKP